MLLEIHQLRGLFGHYRIHVISIIIRMQHRVLKVLLLINFSRHLSLFFNNFCFLIILNLLLLRLFNIIYFRLALLGRKLFRSFLIVNILIIILKRCLVFLFILMLLLVFHLILRLLCKLNFINRHFTPLFLLILYFNLFSNFIIASTVVIILLPKLYLLLQQQIFLFHKLCIHLYIIFLNYILLFLRQSFI